MCAPTNMPTPFEAVRSRKAGGRDAENAGSDPKGEAANAKLGGDHEEWAARTEGMRRSVFGNYCPIDEKDAGSTSAGESPAFAPSVAAKPAGVQSAYSLPEGEGRGAGEETIGSHLRVGTTQPSTRRPLSRSDLSPSLQGAIDTAMARSFLYRFLAQAFEDPTEKGWHLMCGLECLAGFEAAAHTLGNAAPALAERARLFQAQLKPESFTPFLNSYLAAFGHAARGRCPLNEIEYGDIKADPLFQPHRLADLAAFYRAFGLEPGEDADERQDHICLELEFMCVLAAKEAYALEHQLDPEDLGVCCHAQKSFLREHLGRWTPAFTRRLSRLAGDGALGALANLTGAFVEAECARFGLTPGSEDLLLRPVDAAAESLCGSCGLSQLPPGAPVPLNP
jgi:DMSO reductase family type II enzyme chaperone